MEFFIPMWLIMLPVFFALVFLIIVCLAEIKFWWGIEGTATDNLFRTLCIVIGLCLLWWSADQVMQP